MNVITFLDELRNSLLDLQEKHGVKVILFISADGVYIVRIQIKTVLILK